MRRTPLIALAFAAAAVPFAKASAVPRWSGKSDKVPPASATVVSTKTKAIPAWARKYNMNCSGCHAPAVPRLNAKGYAFKWAGWRMPEEIGEQAEIKNVSEVFSVRSRLRYDYAKPEGGSATQNQFELFDVTIFAGGALGKNFGSMFELEHAVGETEIVTNMTGVWGSEKKYAGFRIGQMHWFSRAALAGFERPTGITTPIPLSSAINAGSPWSFSTDQIGGEAFFVRGKNKLSIEVLNGVNAEGKGDETRTGTSMDFVGIDQFIYDAHGSGITLMGYRGKIHGLDPADENAASSITRFGLTANKLINKFELMGTFISSKDNDLPAATAASGSVTGSAYWGYLGYTLPSNMTLFSRYEFLDPNTDAANKSKTRFVLGGVLPISLPEYLKLSAEFLLDTPKDPAKKKVTSFKAELMFNY